MDLGDSCLVFLMTTFFWFAVMVYLLHKDGEKPMNVSLGELLQDAGRIIAAPPKKTPNEIN